MKKINQYLKHILIVAIIALCCNAQAQVNGFTLAAAPGPHNLGTSIPVNVSFNWTPSTTSATVVINYNSSLVSYDPSCSAFLPSCMSVVNSGSQLTITISSLSSCTNTGAISFNVCFAFKCPDSCTGVIKPSTFTGTLTDNLSTSLNASCNTNGMLNNGVSMFQIFLYFNQLTAEVAFRVYIQNPTCFLIKNPMLYVTLPPALGTVVSASNPGINFNTYTYTVLPGNIIKSNSNFTGPSSQFAVDYVIKLPCNTGLGQLLTSNITLKGINCGIPNSIIAGPAAASDTIPAAALPNPNITVYKSSTSSTFSYTIVNSGNTPLNLTTTNFLPLVHLKNVPWSVSQSTSQLGLLGGVKYYSCSNVPTTTYTLTGVATDANAPVANTSKFDHTVNNLLPGQSVSLTSQYDLTSSCSGPAGAPPYKDSLAISYNCIAPPVSCINCNGSGGTQNPVIIYNPQPIINCLANTDIQLCKSIGDTISLCYEFNNSGDAPLIGGQYNIQMPAWLQAINSSVVYTGFSPNPIIAPASNIKFNLPTIPVGTGTYKICFKAVIQTGAVGGGNGYWSVITGANGYSNPNVCYTSFYVCAFAAIGIDKKVKGSLNSSYANSATGAPNTPVDYEITVRNTGTIAVDNLEVIDRIPAIGNFTILGSPASAPVVTQFNMQMLPAPININYTAQFTATQNINTLWPATGTPSFAGVWSGTVVNGGVKFTFNPTYTLAPGASYTYTFQTKIPAGTANSLVACNTAGFIAKSVTAGYTINPVESNPVCIEVVTPEIPPAGCCKDLLKKITTTQSVNKDVLTVNATLTAGPGKLKKVTVSLVNFEVKHPKDCDICVKNPKHFGNITDLTSPLQFNTVPANVPFSHLIEWKDAAGYNFSNGVSLNFSIPLPPRSPIACCCDTIEYCLRYTFTDTACVMCDTTICYKTYNGKDCKSGGGPDEGIVCNCNWQPMLSYEGGRKRLQCGETITLFRGNVPVSLQPNFTCADENGNACKNQPPSVTIEKDNGPATTLVGPLYNYTFLQSGLYQYSMVGLCAGKKCECKFIVKIP